MTRRWRRSGCQTRSLTREQRRIDHAGAALGNRYVVEECNPWWVSRGIITVPTHRSAGGTTAHGRSLSSAERGSIRTALPQINIETLTKSFVELPGSMTTSPLT